MKWIGIPLLSIGTLLALLWVFQRSLVYFPTGLPRSHQRPPAANPFPHHREYYPIARLEVS